jgi:hypothetical protein
MLLLYVGVAVMVVRPAPVTVAVQGVTAEPVYDAATHVIDVVDVAAVIVNEPLA